MTKKKSVLVSLWQWYRNFSLLVRLFWKYKKVKQVGTIKIIFLIDIKSKKQKQNKTKPWTVEYCQLTHERPTHLLYEIQPINLFWKWIDGFLYDNNLVVNCFNFGIIGTFIAYSEKILLRFGFFFIIFVKQLYAKWALSTHTGSKPIIKVLD